MRRCCADPAAVVRVLDVLAGPARWRLATAPGAVLVVHSDSVALPGPGRYGTDGAAGRAADTPPAPTAPPDTGPTRAVTGPGPASSPASAEHREMWELVTRAQGGDGDAFGALYDRYVDVVYRYVHYRVGDRTLAEDLTSDTFLRALRRIRDVDYRGRDIGAWLVTIARNLVLDHAKSARVRLEVTTGDVRDDPDGGLGPEAAMLRRASARRVLEAVNRLGDEQRECIVLRFLEGLSIQETADVMGRTAGAVKALQHRGLRKLADALEEERP